MIVHQRPCIDRCPRFLSQCSESSHKISSIPLVMDNPPLFNASNDHVVQGPWTIESCLPRHNFLPQYSLSVFQSGCDYCPCGSGKKIQKMLLLIRAPLTSESLPLLATAIEVDEHLHRCLVYIDLNMVRVGVVKHPAEWADSDYREIQKPPERYAIIDLPGLSELSGFTEVAHFQQVHRQWVEETLTREMVVRDERWSEAIAVGLIR
jgi:hypothetical protein